MLRIGYNLCMARTKRNLTSEQLETLGTPVGFDGNGYQDPLEIWQERAKTKFEDIMTDPDFDEDIVQVREYAGDPLKLLKAVEILTFKYDLPRYAYKLMQTYIVSNTYDAHNVEPPVRVYSQTDNSIRPSSFPQDEAILWGSFYQKPKVFLLLDPEAQSDEIRRCVTLYYKDYIKPRQQEANKDRLGAIGTKRSRKQHNEAIRYKKEGKLTNPQIWDKTGLSAKAVEKTWNLYLKRKSLYDISNL